MIAKIRTARRARGPSRGDRGWRAGKRISQQHQQYASVTRARAHTDTDTDTDTDTHTHTRLQAYPIPLAALAKQNIDYNNTISVK